MPKPRIAVLFDAENIGCDLAIQTLARLHQLGTLQSACAVGDFTILKPWIACGRAHGIDLVMQPSLGKGKNASDIRLTIEALDLAHRGRIDALALVSNDRDFTPLAFSLREMGLLVLGFGSLAPSEAFQSACSSFEVVTPPAKSLVPVALPMVQPAQACPATARSLLSNAELAELRRIAALACADQDIDHSELARAIKQTAPELAQKLKGKLLKTLVRHGLIKRVGTGATQRLRRAA